MKRIYEELQQLCLETVRTRKHIAMKHFAMEHIAIYVCFILVMPAPGLSDDTLNDCVTEHVSVQHKHDDILICPEENITNCPVPPGKLMLTPNGDWLARPCYDRGPSETCQQGDTFPIRPEHVPFYYVWHILGEHINKYNCNERRFAIKTHMKTRNVHQSYSDLMETIRLSELNLLEMVDVHILMLTEKKILVGLGEAIEKEIATFGLNTSDTHKIKALAKYHKSITFIQRVAAILSSITSLALSLIKFALTSPVDFFVIHFKVIANLIWVFIIPCGFIYIILFDNIFRIHYKLFHLPDWENVCTNLDGKCPCLHAKVKAEMTAIDQKEATDEFQCDLMG